MEGEKSQKLFENGGFLQREIELVKMRSEKK